MMTENRLPAKNDVAVLLLFFNRPSTFGQVFAEVKKARPSRLFLYQDGPRGERDMAGIKVCREIAEDIDWECEVYRMYQEKERRLRPFGVHFPEVGLFCGRQVHRLRG